MIVVGLSGYKRSGKDSVAEILVRDYGFTKMAFADPLKRMVTALDPILGYAKHHLCCDECEPYIEEMRISDLHEQGFTDEQIKDHFIYGPELRRLWETFGTDVFRAEDSDFWVTLAAKELGESPADRVVFTDVRFENEADWIYWLGEDHIKEPAIQSSVWRVARPGVTAGDHAAEQLAGLLGEEVTILNDGSLEDLKEPVALAMDLLMSDVALPGQLAFDFGGNE